MPEGAPTEKTARVGDATSLRMALLAVEDLEGFRREWRKPWYDTERAALSGVPKNCVLESEESARVLLRWLGLVEERMREVSGSDSKQMWLHLTRRIRPDPGAYGVSPETGWLARTTLNLAIAKYGLAEGRQFGWVPANSDTREWIRGDESVLAEKPEPVGGRAALLPKTLTRVDCSRAYQLECLAFQFCVVASGLRRAWKGGRLRVTNGSGENVELDPDTNDLVKLYDHRVSKYLSILSDFGLVADLDDLIGQQGESERGDWSWVVWVPVWNLDGEDVNGVFDKRTATPFVSNYLLMPATLEQWYESAKLFREEVRAAWAVGPEEMVCLLVASSRRHFVIAQEDISFRYQLWQRGYVVIDLRRYARELAPWYRECRKALFGEKISARRSAEETLNVLNALAYQDDDFGRIDLWTRSGAKVLCPVSEGYHFDYSMVPTFLAYVLRSVPITGGAAGLAKGTEFELQAKTIIERLSPQARFWEAPRELEFRDGTRRELDLGVLYENSLFVCECRSHAVPLGFERGEPGDLWEREQKLRAAILKADRLAQKLSRNPTGNNFAIPDGVRFLISCALSPFPEYLPEKTSKFFFDEGHWPRVCVPGELAEFLKSFRIDDHLGKPFVHEVAERRR